MSKNTPVSSVTVPQNGPARKMSKAGPLAARLGLNKKTLFRWADAGHVNRYKINNRIVLFDERQIDEFIDSSRVGGSA
jgi:hypothetical protein